MSKDDAPVAPSSLRGRLLASLQAPTPTAPPDVIISHDKAYTFKLNIALMNRLAAYCARTGARKGASVTAALTAWLDAQEGT